jgi:hypothetical protein
LASTAVADGDVLGGTLPVPGIPTIVIDSFDRKHVHQALPNVTALYGDFLGPAIEALATSTGTCPGLLAALLPAVLSACIGPGLVVTPNSSSSWRSKCNFWSCVVAESGAGELCCGGCTDRLTDAWTYSHSLFTVSSAVVSDCQRNKRLLHQCRLLMQSVWCTSLHWTGN